MVALLTSEELNVLVLLDHEKDAHVAKDDLVKSKLIGDKSVVFVSEGFGSDVPKEADTEDLIDPGVYESLVLESYAKELSGKTLKLNSHIPRVAVRVEAALNELGIAFHKTRPARLFLNRMAKEPASVLAGKSRQRFELLFSKINGLLKARADRPKGAGF